MASNHIVFIVMDSCRYDSMMAAATPNIDRLGQAEKRYSYASWTAPSHYAFTMGLMPHSSPKDVFASEIYKEEFMNWKERTGAGEVTFSDFLPEISLPKVLSKLGYHTVAKVSMPVLNKYTLISKHFDEYKLMSHHNDFATMVEEMEFPDDEPQYYFLNLGETHYPYMLSGDDMPHISGVHGAIKSIGKDAAGGPAEDRRGVRSGAAEDAAQAADQVRRVHRRPDRQADREGAEGHLVHRHFRPRRTVRRGRLLRPRADHAREVFRDSIRRGAGSLRG